MWSTHSTLAGLLLLFITSFASALTPISQTRHVSASGMVSGVPFNYYASAGDFSPFTAEGGTEAGRAMQDSSLFSGGSIEDVILARLAAETTGSGSMTFGSANSYLDYGFELTVPASYTLIWSQNAAPDAAGASYGSLTGPSGTLFQVPFGTPVSGGQLFGSMGTGLYHLMITSTAQNYALAHFDFSLSLQYIPEPSMVLIAAAVLFMARRSPRHAFAF